MKSALFIKKMSLFAATLVCLSSCLKILLTSSGVLEKSITIKYISNENKQVAFIPMHHIGTKEFYDDAQKNIDSFLKLGYTIYYESVKLGTVKDSIQRDSTLKKVRKILGLDLVAVSKTGYLDVEQNRLVGRQFRGLSKYNLMNQPLGLIKYTDIKNYKLVDATFTQLVDECEKKFGPFKLEEYDLSIPLGSSDYKSKPNRDMREFFLTGFRNELISDSILHDQNNKIVVVYGAKHFDGILENLKAADKNFKRVKKL